MVVLHEKDLLVPPPPYISSEDSSSNYRLSFSTSYRLSTMSSASSPTPSHKYRSFSDLPAHLVLYIVYKTLPERNEYDMTGRITPEELGRRTSRVMYWLASHLRCVNRALYLASMHILRSAYLPKYLKLVKRRYTSDPFPLSSEPSKAKGTSIIHSIQRESQILDLFLIFQLRQDVLSGDSSLHLDGEDSLRDLFDFMQPRARLEDLIRDFGVNAGLVYLSATPTRGARSSATTGPSSSPSTRYRSLPSSSSVSLATSNTSRSPFHNLPIVCHPNALPFEVLSISFSPRRVGLVLTARGGRKRTLVEISRDQSETLERCASRLIFELKGWADRAYATNGQ